MIFDDFQWWFDNSWGLKLWKVILEDLRSKFELTLVGKVSFSSDFLDHLLISGELNDVKVNLWLIDDIWWLPMMIWPFLRVVRYFWMTWCWFLSLRFVRRGQFSSDFCRFWIILSHIMMKLMGFRLIND